MDWIDKLKVGDKVVVSTGFRGSLSVAVVQAINKATIKVGNCLYNKTNGKVRGGGSYSSKKIIEPTFNLLHEIDFRKRKYQAISRVQGIDWDFFLNNIKKVIELNNFLDEFIKV